MSRAAVFLDKDGTLVENVPYNVAPERIQLTHRAHEGLRILHAAGFGIYVITNQAGVARGYFPEEALAGVERRLRDLLNEIRVPLDGFYYCPHDSRGTPCSCRKPRPGLVLRAAREHGLDLARSWFVGDILDDIEAGRSAGCRTVLIDNGSETEWKMLPLRWPHYRAPDLEAAARLIADNA